MSIQSQQVLPSSPGQMVFCIQDPLENILSQVKSAADLTRFMRVNKFCYSEIEKYLSAHPEIWQESLLSHFGHQGFQLHLWPNLHAKELFILLYMAMKRNIVPDEFLRDLWQGFDIPKKLFAMSIDALPDLTTSRDEMPMKPHTIDDRYCHPRVQQRNFIYRLLSNDERVILVFASNKPLQMKDSPMPVTTTVNHLNCYLKVRDIIREFPLSILMIDFNVIPVSSQDFLNTMQLVENCLNLRAIYFYGYKMGCGSTKKLLQQIKPYLEKCKQLLLISSEKGQDRSVSRDLAKQLNRDSMALVEHFHLDSSCDSSGGDSRLIGSLCEASKNAANLRRVISSEILWSIEIGAVDFGYREVPNVEIVAKKIFFDLFHHYTYSDTLNLATVNQIIEENFGVNPENINLRELVIYLVDMYRRDLTYETLPSTVIFIICNEVPVTIQQAESIFLTRPADMYWVKYRVCLTYVVSDKRWYLDFMDTTNHCKPLSLRRLDQYNDVFSRNMDAACKMLGNFWTNPMPNQGFLLTTDPFSDSPLSVSYSTFGITEKDDLLPYVLEINTTLAKYFSSENIRKRNEVRERFLDAILPICLKNYGVHTTISTSPFEALKSYTDRDLCRAKLIELPLDDIIVTDSRLKDLKQICERLAKLLYVNDPVVAEKLLNLFEFTYSKSKSLDSTLIIIDAREFFNLLLPYISQLLPYISPGHEEPFCKFLVSSKLLLNRIITGNARDFIQVKELNCVIWGLVHYNSWSKERSIQFNDALFESFKKNGIEDVLVDIVAMWHFYDHGEYDACCKVFIDIMHGYYRKTLITEASIITYIHVMFLLEASAFKFIPASEGNKVFLLLSTFWNSADYARKLLEIRKLPSAMIKIEAICEEILTKWVQYDHFSTLQSYPKSIDDFAYLLLELTNRISNIDLQRAFLDKIDASVKVFQDKIPKDVRMSAQLWRIKFAAVNIDVEPVEVIKNCYNWLNLAKDLSVRSPACTFFANPCKRMNPLTNEKQQIYVLLAESLKRLGKKMYDANQFAIALRHYSQAEKICSKILRHGAIDITIEGQPIQQYLSEICKRIDELKKIQTTVKELNEENDTKESDAKEPDAKRPRSQNNRPSAK